MLESFIESGDLYVTFVLLFICESLTLKTFLIFVTRAYLFYFPSLRMNFLSNILREEGGFDYKKAIVDSIVILIRDIPDAKESGLLHLCEFIEDCEFTYLSTQVGFASSFVLRFWSLFIYIYLLLPFIGW